MYWVKVTQRESYHKEITALLQRSSNNPNRSELSTKTLRSNNNNGFELSTKTRSNNYNGFELSEKTLEPKCNQVSELSKKTLSEKKLISQLGLFLDKNLVKCCGRIQNSSLQYDTRHPVLLPIKHWFTQLVIRDAHQKKLHGGVAETLVNIRRDFWIPKKQ